MGFSNSSRNILKLERLLNKTYGHLEKFTDEFGNKLGALQKADEMIEHCPALGYRFEKLEREKDDLSEENDKLRHKLDSKRWELDSFLDILVNNSSLYILRQPKELWKREIIALFLLKSFSIYDYKKCRFRSMEEKQKVADVFSVNQIRLSDQINLFVNEILRGKYNLTELVPEAYLLRWKYRLILKGDPDIKLTDLKERYQREVGD